MFRHLRRGPWKSKRGINPLRSEEHTSELQSQSNLVCRLLLEKKNIHNLATHGIQLRLMGVTIETYRAIPFNRGGPSYQGAPDEASDHRASYELVLAELALHVT